MSFCESMRYDSNVTIMEENAEKIYKIFLENILGLSREGYKSIYRYALMKSIRSYEEVIFYKNKETKELQGYILARDSMFLREKEILLLVSQSLEIMSKLLSRFIRNSTRHNPANIYTYIIDNEEVIRIYLELGFFIEKYSPKLYPQDLDLVLLRFNNHQVESTETATTDDIH